MTGGTIACGATVQLSSNQRDGMTGGTVACGATVQLSANQRDGMTGGTVACGATWATVTGTLLPSAGRLWNSIPGELKSSPSLDIFKGRLAKITISDPYTKK